MDDEIIGWRGLGEFGEPVDALAQAGLGLVHRRGGMDGGRVGCWTVRLLRPGGLGLVLRSQLMAQQFLRGAGLGEGIFEFADAFGQAAIVGAAVGFQRFEFVKAIAMAADRGHLLGHLQLGGFETRAEALRKHGIFGAQPVTLGLQANERGRHLALHAARTDLDGGCPQPARHEQGDEGCEREPQHDQQYRLGLRHGPSGTQRHDSQSPWRMPACGALRPLNRNHDGRMAAPSAARLTPSCQKGFQVGLPEYFRYPTLAPRRAPTPVRMGASTMLPCCWKLTPSPPMK